MELVTIPATVGAVRPSERAIVRGQRLVQVKFVALPMEPIGERRLFTRKRNWSSLLTSVIHRVIGRLVAARP